MHHESFENVNQTLRRRVESHINESINDCYQCGKCSAGCPLIEEMDFAPNQILRMLQHDNESIDEKILRSYSIWLCLTCEMCSSRCPQDVKLPEVMDFLRSESYYKNMVNPKAKDIVAFHEAFLNSIKSTGRLYEVGLIAGYKLKTLHLMQDVVSAPSLLAKGKLKLTPHLIKNKDSIKRMFNKANEQEVMK